MCLFVLESGVMSAVVDAHELAMTAPGERQRGLSDDLRRSLRERFRKNDAGEALCDKCGSVIPEQETCCIPCDDAERKAYAIKQRLYQLREGWKHSSGWGTHDSAFSPLPRWEYARFTNEEFRRAVSPKLLKAFERWQPEMGNLVVAADTGLGKTSCAIAKCHDNYERAYATAKRGEKDTFWNFVFVSALDLVAARRTHRLGREEPAIIDKALTTSSILILDEVGFEDLRDQTILEIADSRYRLKRTTIVTTGKRPEEFAVRYGAATWRRFVEGGNVVEDFGTVAP